MKTRVAACTIGLVALVGAALAATPGVASAAGEDPSASPITASFASSVGADFLDNQLKLGDFKTWIKSHDGWEQAGYIDQVNDAATLSTKLLWAGDSPLQAEVLEHAAALGIDASIESRPYSLPEIVAAQDKLEAGKAELAAAGFTLTGVIGVQADTPDIVAVGVLNSRNPQLSRSAATGAIEPTLSDFAGVPVDVQFGTKTLPTVGTQQPGAAQAAAATGTRQSDPLPHSAGALMSSSSGLCSSGISVKQKAVHTITARHCNTSVTWDPAGGEGGTFGKKTSNSPNGAATMLNQAGTNRAYDGAWDNSAGYAKTVVKVFDASLNDLICTGGGNSGEHCNIKVTSVAYAFNDGTGNGSVLSFLGEQQTKGGIADIQGDSGGPMVALYGVQSGEVAAAGMIQGILSDSTHPFMTGSDCGRAYSLGSNQCSAVGIFTSMVLITDRWDGVTVAVG
jgi:hypothetical protein